MLHWGEVTAMRTPVLKEAQAPYALTIDDATLAEGPVVTSNPPLHSLKFSFILLLGRDVLNHFYVRLNGPKLAFDLSL